MIIVMEVSCFTLLGLHLSFFPEYLRYNLFNYPVYTYQDSQSQSNRAVPPSIRTTTTCHSDYRLDNSYSRNSMVNNPLCF